MVELVTDIRRLRRRNSVPDTSVQINAPDYVPLVTGRITLEEYALEKATQRVPAFGELISSLDLEVIRVDLPPGSARLWELAGQALQGGQMYTKQQVIDLIKNRTAVTTERAEKGFAMMLESGAIDVTIDPNLFYLGGSTPF